jgi:hypothetical protein
MILQTARQAEGANWNWAQCALLSVSPPIEFPQENPMNRLLLSLAAAGALLLGNAGYAATAAAAAAPAAKPANANAATPTVAPSPMASPTAKAAVAKNHSCRDAKGKFIKCPPAPAKKATCRDAKGKFIKCADADTK